MRRLRPTRYVSFIAPLVASGLIGLLGMLLPAAAGATSPTGVTGTVTNASSSAHKAVANAQICVRGKGGSTTCTSTQAEGKYTIDELTAGEEYTVEFTGNVCVGLSCEPVYVKLLSSAFVAKSGQLTVVNAALLEVDGKISGTVTAAGVPVENVEVCAAESVSKAVLGCQTTSSGGGYTISDLPPGSYKVEFSPLPAPSCKPLSCQPANYITQYWNGRLELEAANTVQVRESETVTGIDAELQPGAHISGRVTNASIYAQPIAGVHVCSRPTRTNTEGEREGGRECAYTNANGEYAIQTLASGGYEVEFTGKVCVESGGAAVKCTHPYIAQFYQAIVAVSAPGTTSGINASLLEVAPAKPVNTAAPILTAAQALAASPETLSCSAGTWAENPTSLAYRWLRDGVAIAGQIANTYTVQKADRGAGISCEVIAANGAGATAARSNTVQIPPPVPGIAVVLGASVRGATVSVKLSCTGAAACSGVLKLVTRLTSGHGRRKRARNVTIGLASFSLALGKRATFSVYLTGAGRKLLGHAGRRGLETQIAGSGVQAHTVMLRAPSKRR